MTGGNGQNGSEAYGTGARRRVLVVGLDAATWDLIMPWVDAGVLPTLQRLMREGVHAPLRSTLPALTPPGWTSAATGRNPGKHNVFNFYRGRGRRPAARAGDAERSARPARVGHRRAAGLEERRAAHAAHVSAAGIASA